MHSLCKDWTLGLEMCWMRLLHCKRSWEQLTETYSLVYNHKLNDFFYSAFSQLPQNGLKHIFHLEWWYSASYLSLSLLIFLLVPMLWLLWQLFSNPSPQLFGNLFPAVIIYWLLSPTYMLLQLLEQALENSRHDLDLAIESLNDLRLGCAEKDRSAANTFSDSQAQPSNQP